MDLINQPFTKPNKNTGHLFLINCISYKKLHNFYCIYKYIKLHFFYFLYGRNCFKIQLICF